MTRRLECGCVYSTSDDPHCRRGSALYGELVRECEMHREQRLNPTHRALAGQTEPGEPT